VAKTLDTRQIDSYIILFGGFNFFYCYYNIMRGDWLGTAVGLTNFLALIYFGVNMKNPEWMKRAGLD